MNKGGLEFSFSWMFAIIVGAVIIVIAIYGTSKIIDTERMTEGSFAGKELGVLLNPIETNLESGKVTLINMGVESKIYNGCKNSGVFGVQEISVATKSGIGSAWKKGLPTKFYNKYIFSSAVVQGKELAVFTKPFGMPYKIGDLTFIWSGDYCFVDPPKEIEDEISELNPRGINISYEASDCPKGSKKVCFTSTGCDINVLLSSNSVHKNKQTLYYEGPLIYGAIFADPGIYECQVKRMMGRASQIALLYKEKSSALSAKGCSSNLEADLDLYSTKTLELNSSADLKEIYPLALDMEDKNEILSCKLF